ncbi:MAG: guanylate kinase [Rickettsiaceae bacterium]|nr:guanylate kinase [Rickettsiaceae bacterium]
MATTSKKEHILLVISGPSGSGKSTIAKAIVRDYNNFTISVSLTTRPMRVGEVNGKDYYFVSPEEFEALRQRQELLEVTELCGNYYGTSRSNIMELMQQGQNIIFDVDYDGAKIIKQNWPLFTVCIFIQPPSLEATKERLISRQDDLKNISQRIEKFEEVMASKDYYEHIVVNDVLENAVAEIRQIIDLHLIDQNK